MTDKDRAFLFTLKAPLGDLQLRRVIALVKGLDAYVSVLERKWVAESKRELDTRVNSAT
jgi:hypothetical protein